MTTPVTYTFNIDADPALETITFDPETLAVTVDGQTTRKTTTLRNGHVQFKTVNTQDKCGHDTVTIDLNPKTLLLTRTEDKLLKGPCVPVDPQYFSDGTGSPVAKDVKYHNVTTCKPLKVPAPDKPEATVPAPKAKVDQA